MAENTNPTVEDKSKEEEEPEVTPWAVKGIVDYTKLTEKFGSQLIDDKLIERFEKLTGKPAHPWLKRGLFFSHRDLNELLNMYEKVNIVISFGLFLKFTGKTILPLHWTRAKQ
jgi:hypothetical protein